METCEYIDQNNNQIKQCSGKINGIYGSYCKKHRRNYLVDDENYIINERFTIEYINISIKNGYMKKEAFVGQYKTFAKNNWAIISSSLTTWEVLDDFKNKYHKILDEIMGHFYPYLTKKGLDRYKTKQKELSKKIDQDFKNL